MEKILELKKSILRNDFKLYFESFIKEHIEDQLIFLKDLKDLNLDLFFYQIVINNGYKDRLNEKVLFHLKQEYILEKGKDAFYKKTFINFLQKTNTDIVVVKGWSLEESINYDLYKRSCDVDVLVLEKNYKSTIKLLEKEFNFFTKDNYFAYGQTCLLNTNSMCIDLHKNLIAFQDFDTMLKLNAEELYKETIVVKQEGVRYLTFNKEMEFIHLCIHFLLHHEGYGFILLAELKIYLEKNYLKLNEIKLINIAKKHECMPFLLFNLMILDKVCVFSKEVKAWLKKIILKNDYDKKIYTSFTSNFKEDSFYKNKAISNLVFKKLIFNTILKKQLFIAAKLKFILHSYFRAKAKALNII